MKENSFNCYDYIRQGDEIMNYFSKSVLERMAELDVIELELPYPVEYDSYFDNTDDKFEMKYINITKIALDTASILSGAAFLHRSLVKFYLDNGETLKMKDIKLSDVFTIIQVLDVIDEAVLDYKRKNKLIKIHFENKDILITDPCYITKEDKRRFEYNPNEKSLPWPDSKDYDLAEKNNWDKFNLTAKQMLACINSYEEYQKKFDERKNIEIKEDKTGESDWDRCECGDNMEVLGLKNYFISSTLYGDWSCTTYDTDTNEVLGYFCADAGLVGVFDLAEVLEYNPDFAKELKEKNHIATVIKGFTGDVWIEVDVEELEHEYDTQWWKKGDKYTEESLHIVGKGNINFRTTQTGA